jgi:hypothetical protein
VLVYRDDESIYFEHRGRECAVVRSTFEMVQGLKMIEDKAEERVEEQADSIKHEAQLLRAIPVAD